MTWNRRKGAWQRRTCCLRPVDLRHDLSFAHAYVEGLISWRIMKILAISDVVADLVQSPLIAQRFKDVDLVLSCGDLPFEYLEYVVTMLCKPLFYVSGNHVQHDVASGDGVVKNKPEGCVDIHRRVVYYRGLLIAGIEGSMRYSDGDHQYTDGQMSMLAAAMAPHFWWNTWRYGRAMDILVTHAPPLGIHDGQDLCHQGFRAFLDLMDRYTPRYLIHGHMHLYRLDAERVTRYGQTTVLNAYGHQVVEIGEPQPGRTQ